MRFSQSLGSQSYRLIASSDAPTISCSGIPFRCEGWPDKALVLRESGDHRTILIVEPDAERLDIGLLAFGARGLRDHDDALLIEEPGDRHLNGPTTVLVAEEGERGITCRPPLREGRIGCQRNPLDAQLGDHPRLRQERIAVELPAGSHRADL